jgi:hypothetical protein
VLAAAAIVVAKFLDAVLGGCLLLQRMVQEFFGIFVVLELCGAVT